MTTADDHEHVTARELDSRIAEVQRAVDLAREASPEGVVLKEYIERVFDEHAKALILARDADQKHYDTALEETQHQIDRRLETQLRERNDTERHLEQQVQAVRELVGQQAKAVEVASEEREKAAGQLRVQFLQQIDTGDKQLSAHIKQQVEQLEQMINSVQRESELRTQAQEKAVEVASTEREKAASQLRDQLVHQISAGDKQLSEHIEISGKYALQQVKQLEQMIIASQRETDLRAAEQEKAILKAETAADKRFHTLNEVRQQMNDLISSHQSAVNDLTATLMPREVAEAKLDEMAKRQEQAKDERGKAVPREVFDRMLEEWGPWRARVDTKLATAVVADDIRRGAQEKQDTKLTGWQLAIAGAAVTLFNTAVIIVATMLTS